MFNRGRLQEEEDALLLLLLGAPCSSFSLDRQQEPVRTRGLRADHTVTGKRGNVFDLKKKTKQNTKIFRMQIFFFKNLP